MSRSRAHPARLVSHPTARHRSGCRGYVDGAITVSHERQNPLAQPVILPFKGTFRIPFAIDTQARPVRSEPRRAAYHPGSDLRALTFLALPEHAGPPQGSLFSLELFGCPGHTRRTRVNTLVSAL
jgi:hypothetical protein